MLAAIQKLIDQKVEEKMAVLKEEIAEKFKKQVVGMVKPSNLLGAARAS